MKKKKKLRKKEIKWLKGFFGIDLNDFLFIF